MPPLPPDDPSDADGVPTGPTMSPADLRAIQAQFELTSAVLTLDASIRRLEGATWTLVVRDTLVAVVGVLGTQLAQPLWPGRVEIRLGTVLALGAAIVAAFGADRGWQALGWAAAHIPSVQFGTTTSAAEVP